MGENICKPCDQQGINLQNLQTAHTAQYQKNKQPSQKMGRMDGRGVWGRTDTCIYMVESLCCAPETITTLLISYTPI